MNLFAFNNPWYALATQFAVLLPLAIILQVLIHFWLRRLITRLEPAGSHEWYLELLKAIRLPAVVLLWALIFGYIIDTVATVVFPELTISNSFVKLFSDLGIIAILLWVIFAFINRIERLYTTGNSVKRFPDLTLVHIASRLAKISMSLIGLSLILSRLGISVASIMTISGVGAAGIAFAAKGLLANFFGGLLLYMNRSFTVGDAISSPDRKIEGKVENIGWFLTCLRDNDKRLIYVPNGIFIDIIVINISRVSNLRISTNIAVRYADSIKISSIVAALEKMVHLHPELSSHHGNIVSLTKLNESDLTVYLNAYTKTTDAVKFASIQQDILLKINEILNQHGAAHAFPTRVIIKQ